MKTITFRQLASIKRTAQSVYPLISKRDKLQAKLDELNGQIDPWEQAVINMTGHKAEELVVKVVSPSLDDNGIQKKDKEGNLLNVTKWEPTELLVFDEKKKVYYLNEEKTEGASEASVQAETPTVDEPVEASNPWE